MAARGAACGGGAVPEAVQRSCVPDTVAPGEKIPYACFRALSISGSDASLTALARIGRATSNGSVLKNLETYQLTDAERQAALYY
jgi:hypothetical protein